MPIICVFDPSIIGRMEGEAAKNGWRQGFGFFNRGANPTMSGKAVPIHQGPPPCCLDLWLERHELPAEVPPTVQPEPRTKQEHAAAARNQQVRARSGLGLGL